MAMDILVVDDESDIRDIIIDLLEDEGYSARGAADGPGTLNEIKKRKPNLVILDIWLGDSQFDGIKALDIIQEDHPGLPVIIMSGHGNIETAVNAIKKGAYEYIEKPFKSDKLLVVVQRALEAAYLRRENVQLIPEIPAKTLLVGESSFTANLWPQLEKAAACQTRVFIQGPVASGKETAARQIHQLSARRKTGSFVVFNAATTPKGQFEKALFGSEKDGKVNHVGALERAHGGTLLLDAIGAVPEDVQSRLTKVIQDGRLKRVDGQDTIDFDVRFITSSTADSKTLEAEGKLRSDLASVLNLMSIKLVPIKDRIEDIQALAQHFCEEYANKYGHAKKALSEEALIALKAYEWSGNLRQLKNVMDWAIILSEGKGAKTIQVDDLPQEITSGIPAVNTTDVSSDIMELPMREARELFEKKYLLSQVSKFAGNISQTAQFVGMERSALHRKLKALGVRD